MHPCTHPYTTLHGHTSAPYADLPFLPTSLLPPLPASPLFPPPPFPPAPPCRPLRGTWQVVIDTSAGHCGTAFDVAVVSPLFEGKRLLERHRMVNSALSDELPHIHALSIKKAWTPEQMQAQQNK
ncbi:unnamed protein product [Closterium sp. NIES-54]